MNIPPDDKRVVQDEDYFAIFDIRHVSSILERIKMEIDKFQNECYHPLAVKVKKMDAQNNSTIRWVEHTCPDCGKKWSRLE